jgi:hypothetical protein
MKTFTLFYDYSSQWEMANKATIEKIKMEIKIVFLMVVWRVDSFE